VVAIPTRLALHRVDAEQNGRIVASGALDEQRVEPIDGIIVELSPHSWERSAIVERLTRHLASAACPPPSSARAMIVA
jgi:hypothetical protein